MSGAGALASLKLGSGRKGQGGIARSFAVQVRSILAVRFRLLISPVDPVVSPYDARHREFRVQFTVETRVTPREPNPRMGRSG